MTGLSVRLEPRSRAATLDPGLSARLADPAWTLARQWVFGEFDGSDGGSPVLARADIARRAPSQVAVAGQETAIDPRDGLIDPLVEAQPLPAGRWPFHARVARGRALAAALQGAGEADSARALLAKFRLAPLSEAACAADPAAAALSAVAAGRVPDGQAVWEALGGPAGSFGWPPGAEAVLVAWAKAIAAADRPSGWDPARLRYGFALQDAGGSPALTAADHRGHGLDWHGFRLDPAAGAALSATSETIARVPASVRFAGMPNPRYWTFEDGQVELGAVTAEPADLARMALLQFAFAYGNDAFVLPVELPVGSLTRVARLTVSDTFGTDTDIAPAARPATAGRGGWSFLGLAGAGPDLAGALFVPAIARGELLGEPSEIAELLRDEMANLVWAVERRVEGEGGRSIDRAEALARGRAPADGPPVETGLRYVLQSAVPENWFPMELDPGARRTLRLATLAPATAAPQGRVLPPLGGAIHEEEVARDGIRLVRRAVLARTPSGRLVAWTRTERRIGRGEADSGLAFDRTTRTT